MKVVKVIFGIIITIFFVVGVPIIINECYKENCGYITVWHGADVLGYYGTTMGSLATVITLVATIVFTRKQIQRDSYLRIEREKLSKLEKIFLEILDCINPIEMLKQVMDNGITNPDKAIYILQKYQLNCKTACDRLNAHLSMSDYPKLREIIESISNISEELVSISQEEIELYSDLRLWIHGETSIKMLRSEGIMPEYCSSEENKFSKEIPKNTSSMDYDGIEKAIAKLNSKIVELYETKYRKLLQLNGATFEDFSTKVQKKADAILRFNRDQLF